jgi:hypothetical protein
MENNKYNYGPRAGNNNEKIKINILKKKFLNTYLIGFEIKKNLYIIKIV